MKTYLKVGFQAAVRNAMDAAHAGHAMQIKKDRNIHNARTRKSNRHKDRIGCVCRFSRALRITVF